MTLAEAGIKLSPILDKQAVTKVKADLSDLEKQLNGLKGLAGKLFAIFGISIGLRNLNAIAEEFNQINDRIKAATDESEDLKKVQEDIKDAAIRSRKSYAEFATQVTSLKDANKKLFPTGDAIRFAEYLNKMGQAAGYSDGELSRMQLAIRRTVTVGKMGTSELMLLMRNTPKVAHMLAESLGTSEDKLMEMAKSGKISAETIKNAILNSKDSIDRGFDQLDYSISDALRDIRTEWGFFVDDVNNSLKITDTLARLLKRGFEFTMGGLRRVRDQLKFLNDKLGGNNNLLKLILASATAIALLVNGPKIISGVKLVGNAVKNAALWFVKLSTGAKLALGAALLLFLLVDDFVNFMKGNDSVIGYAFERAGVDAQDMRDKIVNIWENLKKFWGGIWKGMKTALEPLITAIKNVIKRTFGDDIFDDLGEGLAGVIEFLERFTKRLSEDEELQKFIGGILSIIGVIGVFGPVVIGIIKLVSGLAVVFGAMSGPVLIAVAVIGGLIAAGVLLYKNWDTVKQKAGEIWEGIKTAITTVADAIGQKFDALKEKLTALFDKFGEFRDAVAEKAGEAWDGITSYFDNPETLGGKAKQGAENIAQGIADIFHHSTPKEGPLAGDDQWMPDMMNNFTEGIRNGKGALLAELQDLAASMATVANLGVAAIPTAGLAGAVTNNRSVSQSVVFNNTFNGDKAIQQSTAKTMDNSAQDATAQMARALSYT